MRRIAPDTSALRVMHVASGGFSGATQVALDLTRGSSRHEQVLVLRKKRRTPMERVDQLRREGVPLELVNGWSHLSTVLDLASRIRRWRADVVVGHGFPEHLLARWAGRLAAAQADPAGSAPLLVQVEHNSRERYTAFKRWQVKRLQACTAAFVGVSETVAEGLLAQGLPPARVVAIRNGIDLSPFASSEGQAWEQREAAILMAARFGGQKDHETLIRSLPILARKHGLQPALRLAGGGSASHRQRMEALVGSLGLEGQVHFLGHRRDLPALLMQHRVAALSTHYEGMPLALAEAMAAGCAVVGSDVGAVRETLGNGRWGWLAGHQQPEAWADRLAEVLQGGASVRARVEQAREHARQSLSRQRMVIEHEALIDRLVEQERRGVALSKWRLTA